MGRYTAPPDPYDDFEVGCLRVYYPDSPLLFRALRAQLIELENRFVWETGGDIDAAEKLEQDWLRAGLLTFGAIGEGCADCDDCEQTVIDLTLQLEQCQEQIQEYENMNITVNCNCGCCGGDFDTPTDENGDPYPLIPLDPDDPFSENTPTWDDIAQVPPETYPDYPAWLDDRCKASNYFVDSYITFVEELDLAERQISIGKSLIEVAALLLAALPGPIGDWAGVAVAIKWTAQVISALANLVDDLEDLGDWLQISVDAIEENKDELVCAVYRMSSIDWLYEFYLSFFAGHVDPSITAAGYSQDVSNFMRDATAPLFRELAKRSANAFQNMKIPEDYVAAFDCANCGLANGYSYVPGFFELATDNSGSGVSNEVISIEDAGARLSMSADTTGTGRSVMANVKMVKPPVQTASIVGIGFRVLAANATYTRIADYDGGYGKLWDGGTIEVSLGVYHHVRNVAGDYPLEIPGVDEVGRSDAVGGPVCDVSNTGIALGVKSDTPGTVVFDIYDFFWIVEDGRPCP